MNVREIRIGNWIFDDEGCLCKVIGLSPFDHSVRCDEIEGCNILVDVFPQDGRILSGYETDSPDCKPIPITEEWLLRFGFKKGGTPNYNFKLIDQEEIQEFYIFCNHIGDQNNYRFGITLVDSEYTETDELSISLQIQYVHQLQNIYFSLTGEELTIKCKQ